MNKSDLRTIGEFTIKITLIIAIIYLVYDAFSVFMPIALSVFLAVVLNPAVNRLNEVNFFGKTVKINRTVAIWLVILAFFLCLVAIIFFVVVPFWGEIKTLMGGLPTLIDSFRQSSSDFMTRIQLLELPTDIEDLIKETLIGVSDYIFSLFKSAMKGTIAFAQNILGFLIMPILVFYFIQDGEALYTGLVKTLPKVWQKKANKILIESAEVISAYTRSIVIVGLISGFIVGVGTSVIGLEYSLVFAILAVLAEAVPIVGPIICSLPAILFATLMGTETLVIVIIFYFIYYKIDAYYIVPSVAGKTLSLHPVLIIVSILIGGEFAGAFGMIFAVPAFALIRVLYNNIIEQGEDRDEGF